MIRDAAIEKVLFGPMNVVENDTLILRKDLAMIIDSPPRFVQAFFRPVHWGLSKPQFHHLWTLVLSILLNLRRQADPSGGRVARPYTPYDPRRLPVAVGLGCGGSARYRSAALFSAGKAYHMIGEHELAVEALQQAGDALAAMGRSFPEDASQALMDSMAAIDRP